MEFSFLEILILLLLGTLFFKEQMAELFRAKFLGKKKSKDSVAGLSYEERIATLEFLGKEKDEKVHNVLLESFNRLESHFNHETTDLLQKISENTKATNDKLGEFEKYGIPCRKKE